MLSFATYIIICLVILGIASTILSMFTDGDARDVFGFFILLFFAVAVLICGVCAVPDKSYSTICINNNATHNVLRIKYQQYHTFTDDTIETVVLMPDQAKIFKDVKIVSKQYIKLSDLYKTNY